MELNKVNLEKLYIDKKFGTRKCGEVFNVSQFTICKRLKEFGIKARDYTENKMPLKKGDKMKEAHKKAISEHHKKDPNWHMRGRFLDKHHNWKGGVRAYRRMKLSEVPLLCAKCGAREIVREKTNLHVHHIDHNRKNNRLDNLVVLCASCHKKTHLQ